MTPSAGQNRPRVSRHERASAAPMPAFSRMIADGTSSSFTLSQSASGIAPRTTSTPRAIAIGRAAKPISTSTPTTTAISTDTARVSRNE